MKKKLIKILTLFAFFPITIVNADNNSLMVLNTYQKVVCGDMEIPYIVAQISATIVDILKIITPIIIIIMGMIDLTKSVMAQKEDEIKKGQQAFLKRIFLGAAVFLVFLLVEVIIGLVAPKDKNTNMWNCVDCFINKNCQDIIK